MQCSICKRDPQGNHIPFKGYILCLSCSFEIHELVMVHIVATTKLHAPVKPSFHYHKKHDHPDIHP